MSRKPRFSSSKLLAELEAALDEKTPLSRSARSVQLDYARHERTGAPEIIQAGQKTAEQVVELARRMVERNGRVLVSRVNDELHSKILEGLQNHHIERPVGSSILRISTPSSQVDPGEGRIAVFTAGTSDLAIAEEIRLVAAEMGCRTRIWADIGVAGLHRLVRPFREAIDDDVDVLVVVAGMDGALPSVIAGLSPVPVIGLPTSTGYGFGGDGEAALMSMLQTCSPGLTVVNVDNSVGAAIAAARIANLAHAEVDR